MRVDLDRKGLEALVKGSQPDFSEFDNPLIKKAGHSYNDQYGRTYWDNLHELTDEGLYNVYLICHNRLHKVENCEKRTIPYVPKKDRASFREGLEIREDDIIKTEPIRILDGAGIGCCVIIAFFLLFSYCVFIYQR